MDTGQRARILSDGTGYVCLFDDAFAPLVNALAWHPGGAASVAETMPEADGPGLWSSPNPFGLSAQISLALPQQCSVSLVVTDPSGRLVRTLCRGKLDKGRHTYTWDGRDDLGNPVSTGMYFYSLKTPEGTKSRKMMLLK
jgi:hypothetical protein